MLLPVLLLLAGCSNPENTNDELEGYFLEAEETYGVPRDLLVAISYSLTRLDQDVPASYSDAGEIVGIMGLRVGAEPDAEDAANLVGVNVDLLRENPRENILAAAAWLRDERISRVELTGEPIDTLEEWYPVVASYSGVDEASIAEGFAAQVYDFLEYGVFADAYNGEYIEVTPRQLVWRNDRVATAGSGLIAQFVPASSSNYSDYSRGLGDITYIIVHTIQGSYSGCISWFQNSAASVSAHYVVRSSDGQITQMVDEEDVAWHAGNWDYNLHSVGIEHEGYVSDASWYTDAMYASSAALVADICDRNGIPKDRAHILGHNEVPGATHTDPGSYWDWDRFMDLVNSGGGGATIDPGLEGARSGRFSATASASRYGVTDQCTGPITGQYVGGQLYLTGVCTLEEHGDRVGDLRVTWTASTVEGRLDGRLVVDSYSDPWSGEMDETGRVTATMSGSKDLGGDVGVIQYNVSIDAAM